MQKYKMFTENKTIQSNLIKTPNQSKNPQTPTLQFWSNKAIDHNSNARI